MRQAAKVGLLSMSVFSVLSFFSAFSQAPVARLYRPIGANGGDRIAAQLPDEGERVACISPAPLRPVAPSTRSGRQPFTSKSNESSWMGNDSSQVRFRLAPNQKTRKFLAKGIRLFRFILKKVAQEI